MPTQRPCTLPSAASDPARRSSRQLLRAVASWLALGVLALVGITMAPTAIGGPVSYVVTDGTSMLPTYEAGGVVLTRERKSYGIGDVVGYRNPDLAGLIVLHRIIDTDSGRFVMQGDNNSFEDGYHPLPADVVGKAWVYLPGVGSVLQWTRQPLAFGLIIAVLSLVVMRPTASTRSRRARRRRAR